MGRQFWADGFRPRRASAAWGCALGDDASHLVALGGAAEGCLRVLSSLPQAAAPVLDDEDEPAGLLSVAPLLAGLTSSQARALQGVRDCGVSLPASRCVSAWGPWPAEREEDEVAPEVHLEAASLLGLVPEDVCFDLECPADADPAQGGRRWRWAACARADLRQLRRAMRTLRLRLWAVEPEAQAAERAWVHLVEGDEALWSTAPADWHFAFTPQRALRDMPLPDPARSLPLVACGLALAPLLETVRDGA